jgi:hypothetical protein
VFTHARFAAIEVVGMHHEDQQWLSVSGRGKSVSHINNADVLDVAGGLEKLR